MLEEYALESVAGLRPGLVSIQYYTSLVHCRTKSLYPNAALTVLSNGRVQNPAQ